MCYQGFILEFHFGGEAHGEGEGRLIIGLIFGGGGGGGEVALVWGVG